MVCVCVSLCPPCRCPMPCPCHAGRSKQASLTHELDQRKEGGGGGRGRGGKRKKEADKKKTSVQVRRDTGRRDVARPLPPAALLPAASNHLLLACFSDLSTHPRQAWISKETCSQRLIMFEFDCVPASSSVLVFPLFLCVHACDRWYLCSSHAIPSLTPSVLTASFIAHSSTHSPPSSFSTHRHGGQYSCRHGV